MAVRNLQESALRYARKGLKVIPLHSATKQGCSCGNSDCRSPAKHPRTPHGCLDGTADPNQVTVWWEKWPDANIGIVTGSYAGFFVLDVDTRKGGTESLNRLQLEHTAFPDTLYQISGGGGEHFFFKFPDGVRIPSRSGILPGIDVRGENSFFVAPPSRHVSGRVYEWVAKRPFAAAPDWLLAMLTEPDELKKSAPVQDKIPEGQRNRTWTSSAGTTRRRSMDLEEILAALTKSDEGRSSPPAVHTDLGNITTSASSYRTEKSLAFDDVTERRIERPKWPEMAPEAFQGIAGELVLKIEPHTEADPVALLLENLVSFGNVVGRGPHFLAEDDRHGLNLFTVLVGETSKGRKGTSLGRTRASFRDIDPEWEQDRIEFGLSSGEGLIWAVRDPVEEQKPIREKGHITGYQTVVTDPGVTDKRLLAVETEFASTLRVLCRKGNTLSAVIRSAWDSGKLRTLTKNSPASATNAHISLIGHVTRTELLRYPNSTQAGNGFGSRFLWACVRRSRTLPEGGSPSQEGISNLIRRLSESVEFARSVGLIQQDEAAREVWSSVYPELSAAKPGLLGTIIARAEAQVMRLACIYALQDRSRLIRREHLGAALAVWDYCEASARYIFGEALGDPVADQILAAVKRSPGITRTQIRDLFNRNRPKHRIDHAFSLLVEQRLIEVRNEKTGGRPAERFFPRNNEQQ